MPVIKMWQEDGAIWAQVQSLDGFHRVPNITINRVKEALPAIFIELQATALCVDATGKSATAGQCNKCHVAENFKSNFTSPSKLTGLKADRSC
jgi:hypothetical protein